MKSLKRPIRIALLALLIPVFTSCMHQKEVHVLKLAHGLDPSHPVHKAMVYMAEP